jgi:hypothetical protein
LRQFPIPISGRAISGENEIFSMKNLFEIAIRKVWAWLHHEEGSPTPSSESSTGRASDLRQWEEAAWFERWLKLARVRHVTEEDLKRSEEDLEN